MPAVFFSARNSFSFRYHPYANHKTIFLAEKVGIARRSGFARRLGIPKVWDRIRLRGLKEVTRLLICPGPLVNFS